MRAHEGQALLSLFHDTAQTPRAPRPARPSRHAHTRMPAHGHEDQGRRHREDRARVLSSLCWPRRFAGGQPCAPTGPSATPALPREPRHRACTWTAAQGTHARALQSSLARRREWRDGQTAAFHGYIVWRMRSGEAFPHFLHRGCRGSHRACRDAIFRELCSHMGEAATWTRGGAPPAGVGANIGLCAACLLPKKTVRVCTRCPECRA